MDYRYLKAFAQTAKHLNFSKAALELNIAQSAVSRQIRLLEESIDDELIIRSSKKVILTDKGRELFLSIQKFEKSIDSILNKEKIKTIRVGILHGLLENWFASVLSQYKSKYKNNIVVTVGEPRQLASGISDGHLDIIFTTDEIQNEMISSLKLFNEKLVLISKREIDPAKIENYPWIAYGEENDFYKNFKKRSHDITMVNSITAIVTLVKNDTGIAIVPEHILRPTDKLKTYDLKTLTSASSLIYMATLNYKTLPKHLKELTEICNQVIKKFQ